MIAEDRSAAVQIGTVSSEPQASVQTDRQVESPHNKEGR